MQLQIVFPKVEAHQIVHRFENMPHSHDGHYQVTIPTSGTCHFTYEHKRIDLSAGDMLVLHPADRHCFHIGDGASVLIVIAKEEELAQMGQPWKEETLVSRFIDPHQAKNLFQAWMARNMLDTGEWLAGQEAEAALLEDVRSMLVGDRHKPAAAVPSQTKPSDRHIARAAEYIREHYAEQMSIDELAAVALQSRYHFIRSFKSAIGMSPYQYVLHLRMEEAKRLLRQTAYTATEISYRLGFSAPSQFYRAFEKTVRSTPEQYRSGV